MPLTSKHSKRVVIPVFLAIAFLIYYFMSSQPRVNYPIEPIKMAESSRVTTNTFRDRKIFYREAIPDNQKTKFTVLFLHGQRFSSKNWDDVGTMDLLASKGFRSVAIDLPGYGKSPLQDKELDESGKVNLLFNVVESLNMDKPVIVSPSMSGTYALPFIFERGEAVRGFVAVAPVGTEKYEGGHYEKIDIPTLIIYGDNDNTGLGKERSSLLAAIPRSEIKVIEKAGHACYLDNPSQFHEHLVAFLDSLPRDAVAE